MSPAAPAADLTLTHLARGARLSTVWTDDFLTALRSRATLTSLEHTRDLHDAEAADTIRASRVAIVGWDARPVPVELADDPGRLQYICCYSGSVRGLVPRELVQAGITVSNWGDLPAAGVAESAMTLLLTCIHDMPVIRRAQIDGAWTFDRSRTGTLDGVAVGIVGLGVIGRRFVEMLRPFGAEILVYDPYVSEVPDGVASVPTLSALCERAEALVVHAGLSGETTQMVRAEHLARLPDGGIVVNTARGAILDQEALFAELTAGRLRAGLDVLCGEGPDHLPADHPLRSADNVTFTFHQLTDEGGDAWPPRPGPTPMQRRVIDQIDRFAAGQRPHWVFDLDRYDRST
ncbi:MAG: NAD(P)-dependent oxidoreductase [Actinomycetota bacterium]